MQQDPPSSAWNKLYRSSSSSSASSPSASSSAASSAPQTQVSPATSVGPAHHYNHTKASSTIRPPPPTHPSTRTSQSSSSSSSSASTASTPCLTSSHVRPNRNRTADVLSIHKSFDMTFVHEPSSPTSLPLSQSQQQQQQQPRAASEKAASRWSDVRDEADTEDDNTRMRESQSQSESESYSSGGVCMDSDEFSRYGDEERIYKSTETNLATSIIMAQPSRQCPRNSSSNNSGNSSIATDETVSENIQGSMGSNTFRAGNNRGITSVSSSKAKRHHTDSEDERDMSLQANPLKHKEQGNDRASAEKTHSLSA
ncbi:hypothetical protein EMPS_10101 [Entomortierella parvispora]|uniref:Uncharacterized protein n=1 Tax=Entomortierella parvispora TaxID=205924 RepID=A0A9P3HJE3_9FUNG|nr:hypothetical protein EMPS_10101 [Entomortierella parvispora]